MTTNTQKIIWNSPKNMVNLQVGIVSFVNILSLIALFWFWNSIKFNNKIVLIICPIILMLFLLIFVRNIELGKHNFIIKTAFETKIFDYKNIKSIEISEKIGNDYLIIRLITPIYIRKTLTFQIAQDKTEVIQAINFLLSKASNLRNNIKLSDKYRYNPEIGEIECL